MPTFKCIRCGLRDVIVADMNKTDGFCDQCDPMRDMVPSEAECIWNGKPVSAAEFHARKFCACGNYKESGRPVCKVCLPGWLRANNGSTP